MNKSPFVVAISLFLFVQPAAARVFNSSIKLKVYARGSNEVPDRVLGFTPSRPGHPVRIPSNELWYVRPLGPMSVKKLEQLARLQIKEKIPGIDLSDHWELTNESLRHFKSMTRLVFLDLSRTKISDAGLASLKSNKELAVLILPEAITDQGLALLKGMPLRELNLDRTRITDAGLQLLAGKTSLQSLDLSGTRTSDGGVAFLSKLPHLKRLVLSGAITDASAPHLAELKNLRDVDISQTSISTQGLAALASLPKLKTVYLGKQVTDTGLEALSKSSSLKTLDLTRTGVTDHGMKYLSRVKTLEEVALTQTSVGNACLASLAELPELRMLELSDTRVTSAGLAPLARLKKLEVISLSWQKLSREDLAGMAKLKQLKTIVLNGVPLSEVTMVQLKSLGSPSPWDKIEGIEAAQLRKGQGMDKTVIGAPVVVASKSEPAMRLREPTALSSHAASGTPTASLGLAVGVVPAPRRGGRDKGSMTSVRIPKSQRLSKEKLLVSLPTKPDSIDERKSGPSTEVGRTKLVSKEPSARSETVTPGSQGLPPKGEETLAAVAPVDVTPKKVSEDNLLQAISLQSNPARAGGFGGLSGMRQLRHSENMVAINTISTGGKATIANQEDKPENYLGEINATAGH